MGTSERSKRRASVSELNFRLDLFFAAITLLLVQSLSNRECEGCQELREPLAEREGQITRRDQTIVANEGPINGLTKEVKTLKISLEKSENKLRFKRAHVDRLEAELKVEKKSGQGSRASSGEHG